MRLQVRYLMSWWSFSRILARERGAERIVRTVACSPLLVRGVPQITGASIGLSNSHDIVQTTAADFWYLFDVAHGRLVAAWGIGRGGTEPLATSRVWRGTR